MQQLIEKIQNSPCPMVPHPHAVPRKKTKKNHSKRQRKLHNSWVVSQSVAVALHLYRCGNREVRNGDALPPTIRLTVCRWRRHAQHYPKQNPRRVRVSCAVNLFLLITAWIPCAHPDTQEACAYANVLIIIMRGLQTCLWCVCCVIGDLWGIKALHGLVCWRQANKRIVRK